MMSLQADGSDQPASGSPGASDIPARLQNLRNLLNSERHLGAEQRRAWEAFDREMDEMSADRAAARERRRRDLEESHLPDPDQDFPAVSESPPASSGSPSTLVRTRRRAFRPSERLQRYQRERLGQGGRTMSNDSYGSTGGHLSPSTTAPSPSVGDGHVHRGERLRVKRRKLDDGTYEDDSKTFRYGYNGQVVPGHLRLEIVSCDGGEYTDPQAPHMTLNSWPQNVLQDDCSVYCTKSNRCNMLFKHVGGMPFTLTKIVVKAPRSGYDAPIQEGMIFVSMDDENLLGRTSQYEIRYSPPKPHRHHRHRYDSYRPSHEYMHPTRSPLRSVDRSRYLRDPRSFWPGYDAADDDRPALDTSLVPGFQVSVADPSDEEEAPDGGGGGGGVPPSPRPWYDDEYSLRSYIDRYRPAYGGSDRHDGLSSTSSESEDDADPPSRRSARRFGQQQPLPMDDVLSHGGRMLDLMRAQPVRDSLPEYYNRRRSQQSELHDDGPYNRRSTPSRIEIRASAPAMGSSHDRTAFPDENTALSPSLDGSARLKSSREDLASHSPRSAETLVPHARFFIQRHKSSIGVKFDPPV